MALSLNPTLAIAQDSANRHPICSIISEAYVADIPFDGSFFSMVRTDQRGPAVITHFTGGIYCVYTENSQQEIKFYYTDVDRIEWLIAIVVPYVGGHVLRQPAICELDNGNLGIVYIRRHAGNDYLQYVVVDVSGSIVVVETTIASYSIASYLIDASNLVLLANGTYVLVYEHKNISTGVYNLMKRTSVNFIAWSAESPITLTGLTTTSGKYHPFLIQISTNELFLYFTYVDDIVDEKELTNIYYSISSDNGATWNTPLAATSYDTHALTATHPCVAQKNIGQQHLVYTQESSVLHMDHNTEFWEIDGCGTFGYGCDWLHYDPATDKLYVIGRFAFTGTKRLCGVQVIDVSTWTVTRSYTSASVPAYNGIFNNSDARACKSAEHYVAFRSGDVFSIIDDETETIKLYAFSDNETYGITQNIVSPHGGSVADLQIDAVNNKCYVFLYVNQMTDRRLIVGYINMSEVINPITGHYTWYEILYSYNEYSTYALAGVLSFLVVPEENYIFITSCGSLGSWEKLLLVYSLSTGYRIKHYNPAEYPLFHRYSIASMAYQDGHLYGEICYTTDYGLGDRRGMMKINLLTDAMTYHRPSYATLNDYGLNMILAIGSGELILATSFGIAFYYVDADAWYLYDNDNVPGLNPAEDCYFTGVDYDRVSNRIFCCSAWTTTNWDWAGIALFYPGGVLKQPYYSIGTYTTQWDWASPALLVSGAFSDETVVTLDEDGSIWGIWIDGKNSSEFRLKWDMETASFDLVPFIPDDTEVAVSWGVEQHNQLTFSLAKGHLFDPFNVLSVYSKLVAKNRKLIVKFGEKIAAVEYWQDQGIFYVVSTRMTYERGKDPILNIIAEDARLAWPEQTIVATEHYNGVNPALMLQDIFESFGNMESGDFDFPASFAEGHLIWHQFIDSSLKSIADAVMDHYGYITYYDVAGKFTARKITNNNPVDHTYPDVTRLIAFSPDDSFSSNINRVVVEGETRDYIEVLYPEESVASVSGEMGWWKGTKELDVPFSDDRQRIVKNIRLHKIDSVSNFKIFFLSLGSITEEITTEEDTYCIIEVTAPDLMMPILANLAAVIALGVKCAKCDGYITGYCGWCIFSLTTLVNTLLMMVGAVAHYNYEIYGYPAGREKQCLQAIWDDTELQALLNGLIVEHRFDDPFCYSVASCQTVADQEGMVLQMQRNRVGFRKIAHLQDEITDTLQVIHPYGLFPFNVFVTNLTRKFRKAGKSGGSGYFIDDVTGWRLSS